MQLFNLVTELRNDRNLGRQDFIFFGANVSRASTIQVREVLLNLQ